jgi:hypothetical protein
VVTEQEHAYPSITFGQGDRIKILGAGGCVQTGGIGKTSKRYVDPLGDNADRLYHGLINVLGVTQGPWRLSGLIGQELRIPVDGTAPRSQPLVLGYEDDQYDDNSYDQDDGNPAQCAGLGDAYVAFSITREPWGEWIEIPGGGRAISAPSGEFFYRDLRVFIAGLDQGIYQNTFNGTSWAGWQRLPIGGQTAVQLAPIAYVHGLFLFHTGLDGHVYYAVQSTSDTNSWGPWQQVPGDVRTTLPVAVATSYEGLYLLARSAAGNLFLNVLAPNPPASTNWEWRGWEAFDGTAPPASIPVAANNRGANARVIAVDTRDKVRAREWIYQGSTPTPVGSWSDWSVLPSYFFGREHRRPTTAPIAVSATKDTLQANIPRRLVVLGPEETDAWHALPPLRTLLPIPGASRFKGGQTLKPGMSELYLFATAIDGRLFYTTRAPVEPYPPPPQISVTEFEAVPNYIDPGQSVSLRWAYSSNATCQTVDATIDLKVLGDPLQQVIVRPNASSPGESSTTPPTGPGVKAYTIHVTCRGTSASDSDTTGVTLSPIQPPPTGILVVIGPFLPITIHEMENFTVTYVFQNVGGKTLDGGDVALYLDNTQFGESETVPDLEPGETHSVTWNVTKDLTAGRHVLELRYKDTGGVYGHYEFLIEPAGTP